MSPPAPHYWLVKSEPETFSYADLQRSPRRTTAWDGVRNYQARNYLRDGLRKGDQVLFYHSNAKPPAVVGLCEVTREAYPDPTQFDPRSDYHDPASEADDPRWVVIDLRALEAFAKPVTLPDLRANARLAELALLQRGQRLSVMPVGAAHFREILRMGGLAGD